MYIPVKAIPLRDILASVSSGQIFFYPELLQDHISLFGCGLVPIYSCEANMNSPHEWRRVRL